MAKLTAALRVCWQRVPIKYRAAVKQLPDVVKLDFPEKDLYIHVNSSVDLFRARACRKEPGTIRWIRETVAGDGVFYDIGANVGAYSLVAWACSRGDARIVAFEPGFSTFPQLCRNILINGCEEMVTPLNVALSDKSALQHFRYASLVAGAACHPGLGSTTSNSDPRASEVSFSQPMWVEPLDEVIEKFRLPPPNHIKLDVDGHELAVLRGAKATLAGNSVRSIQVEMGEGDPDSKEILTLLQSYGFAVSTISHHPTAGMADYVFCRTDPAL